MQTLTELGSCINMEWLPVIASYTREFLLQSRHLHDPCPQLNRNQRLRKHRNRKNSFKIAKWKIIVFLTNVKKSDLKLMNREIDELYDFFLWSRIFIFFFYFSHESKCFGDSFFVFVLPTVLSPSLNRDASSNLHFSQIPGMAALTQQSVLVT